MMKSIAKYEAPGQLEGLDVYMREVQAFPLLSRQDEFDLARRYFETQDREAAQKLVTSNLRFVVKVAYQYRQYGVRLVDLVQEGNVGLMMAVKRFNPFKGYRLISYAVWWIRAYMHNYLMSTWSSVKLGTTQAQRKLFFKLRSALKRRDDAAREGVELDVATELGVLPAELQDMEMRLSARDFSLDAAASQDSQITHLDLLPAATPSQEDVVIERQEHAVNSARLNQALEQLNARERNIVEQRLLTEEPATLEELGHRFGVSKERIRQIEENARKKLQRFLMPAPAPVL